jgi:acetate kinase
MSGCVLTINGGSSSLKFALFEPGAPPRRLLSGQVERIGQDGPTLTLKGGDGKAEHQNIAAADHAEAVAGLIRRLEQQGVFARVAAVGHRVVHGGPRYSAPQRVTPELLAELRRLSPLDPAHLPGEIALIEAFTKHSPGLPQVACFDTAFHRTMPQVARLLPIPRRYQAAGVERYGFHGLSYAYLMEELTRVAGAEAARGRVVLAHLGAGASMAAVRGGKCIDTSMGFTPTAGLVMATRCGDLDPGVLVNLLRLEKMTADGLDELVNKQSGLLGVSETSPDMRDLLARQADDPRAADAVALFCYQAKKWLGAFAAALGGLDTLVFAGGIGENAPEVRARICEGLEFLGVRLDAARNAAGAAVISADAAPCTVRVIRTDEESLIARTVYRILPPAA